MPGRIIVVGRIVGPFGVKGWVKLKTFTDSPEILRRQAGWWIGRDGDWHESGTVQTQQNGAMLLARFEGCETPEAALAYRGLEVGLPRESLPPAGANEFYLADLIGLEVVNMEGEVLGTLAELFSNGAHDVMRVVDGEAERLLPFIDRFVREVDIDARRILVEWGKDW